MKVRKILLILMLTVILFSFVFSLLFFSFKYTSENQDKISIVVSNFACYDFVRAIIGQSDKFSLTFLIGPGKDAHSFDPTAQDLIKIEKSNLFVYIGGDLESNWSDKVLSSINTSNTEVMCISDFVKKENEEKIDGVEIKDNEEEEGAFNEHIWTSPENAKLMLKALEEKIIMQDPSNKDIYTKNSLEYMQKIDDVDSKISEVLKRKVRNRLVFGDRMPMQYFVNYYHLNVSAAFDGCSYDNEPSTKTIAYLTDIVKDQNIPVVLYTELNDGKIANLITKEAANGSIALKIQTLHNLSLEDFKNGETWVSLMMRNIEVLEKALTK